MSCLPKLLILWTSNSFIHNQVILNLFDKREQEKENINVAFKRFVEGQYNVMYNKIDKKSLKEQEN